MKRIDEERKKALQKAEEERLKKEKEEQDRLKKESQEPGFKEMLRSQTSEKYCLVLFGYLLTRISAVPQKRWNNKRSMRKQFRMKCCAELQITLADLRKQMHATQGRLKSIIQELIVRRKKGFGKKKKKKRKRKG